jgi:hypothetical protein
MTSKFLAAVLMAGSLATSAGAAQRRVVYFSDGDREVVRTYYTQLNRNGCPQGLVRRGDVCLTRNQARAQRYAIGHPLARNVVIRPVPAPLYQRLSPVPAGYQYGLVDGDLVRYDTKTRLVVDAIRALLD